VNDENIIGQNHSEVVELIRKSGSSCRLVVISPAPTLDLTDDAQIMLQMPREVRRCHFLSLIPIAVRFGTQRQRLRLRAAFRKEAENEHDVLHDEAA
jgi:hypothetical protein